jgi:anti-sigma factor RsiW
MIRRPSLSCREFRHQHVEYVDGLLSGEVRRTCDSHLAECPACVASDVHIRRAILTLQVLPEIAPSAHFRARLNARLAAETPRRVLTFPAAFHESRRRDARWWIVGAALAASAALLVFAPGHPAPVSQTISAPVIAHATVTPPAAAPTAPEGSVVRDRAATQHTTPRFEALPGTVPLGGAPMPPHLSGVRLQTVTYIGQ